MNRRSLIFCTVLLVFQAIRFGFTTAFLTSRWQQHALWFAMVGTWIDIFALSKFFSFMGMKTNSEQMLPSLGTRDRNNLKMIGLILFVCSTAFCASVVLIDGTTTVMPAGTLQRAVSVSQIDQHPEAGCLEITDAAPQLDFLGAVEYSLTSRVTEYFYAVPFVADSWTADCEVSAWAILSEGDLSNDDLSHRRFAARVPEHNLHYEAFRLAVTNAEQRFALTSSPNAVLVRLLSDPPVSNGYLSGRVFWIALIHVVALLAVLPWAIRAGVPESDAATGQDSNIQSASDAAEFTAAAQVIPANNVDHSQTEVRHEVGAIAPQWLQTRRFWLMAHVGGFILLSVCLLSAPVAWPGFVLTFVLPPLEIWLAMTAFRSKVIRASGRYAALVLMLPLSLFFGTLLVSCGAFGLSETRGIQDAPSLDSDTNSLPAGVSCFIVKGDLQRRDDLTGSFWAPDETSRCRRMTPVVPVGWTADEPVRFWLESTDRDESRFAGQPLQFVRRSSKPNDIRRGKALEDTLTRNGLTAVSGPVVLEMVVDPESRESAAGGFFLLGFMGCLLAWSISACYWPGKNSSPSV